MNRTYARRLSLVTLSLALVLFGAQIALAGPPLICHPFNIGTAQSLAWTNQPDWRGDVAGYDVSHLTDETLALLTPTTPVIVRMETLRRAAIYALRDEKVADQLLTRLVDRTRKATNGAMADTKTAATANIGTKGDAKTDALVWFDAGYFVETFRQAAMTVRDKTSAAAMEKLVANANGYPMVQKSLMLRGSDPAIEFAAAIITLTRDRADQPAHAAKARDGATQDALLAQNIDMLTAWATK